MGGVWVGPRVGVGRSFGGVVVGAGVEVGVGAGVASPGGGEGTAAGPAGAVGTGDGGPAMPGGEAEDGAGVGPGDGGTLGALVDQMGTVMTGPEVGAAPRVPIVVGEPPGAVVDEVEPVRPAGSAGSAGPPTSTVMRVTAASPPAATPSAWRTLPAPSTGFRAP